MKSLEKENQDPKKSNSPNKDLTVGKPETVLWQFCLPLFGSIIFQQLYNIADSLVAGKFIYGIGIAFLTKRSPVSFATR